MKWYTKLLLFAFTSAAAAFLLNWTSEYFGVRSIPFALIANLLIIIWIAIMGEIYVFAYPPRYFNIKGFEKKGQLYEKLGIRIFKKLVGCAPYSIFNPGARFDGKLSSIPWLERESRKVETVHFTIFLVVLPFAVMSLVQGWFDTAGWLLLFCLLFNLYPIMLQRYNRIRIYRIAEKYKPGRKSKLKTRK